LLLLYRKIQVALSNPGLVGVEPCRKGWIKAQKEATED
jgi:hypothetical protein